MNRPIDIEIYEAKQKIVGILNESPLPACIMQMILGEILDNVMRASGLEYQKHSAELAEAEAQKKRQGV